MAGVGVAVGAVALGTSTTATATNDHTIQTDVVLRDWNGVVIPVCSQCKAGTKKVSANAGSSSTGAVVTFTYADDEHTAYVGRVRITVLRNDEPDREAHYGYMTIADGQTVTFELGNGADWMWDEVGLVLFELNDWQ